MRAMRLRTILLAATAVMTLGWVDTPAQAGEATTKEVLSSLRPDGSANEPAKLSFEMLYEEKPIGFLAYSLTSRSEKEGGGYAYRVETEIVMPNGMRVKGLVTSHLSPTFEPKSVEMRRTATTPDGTTQSTIGTAKIGSETVTLHSGIQGGILRQSTVASPQRPYVFGVEFLVQRINARRFPKFALNVFNPQNGRIIAHHFVAKPGPDKGTDISSTKDDGGTGHHFGLDAKGKIISMSDSGLPVTSKRCSPERIEQLRRSFEKK